MDTTQTVTNIKILQKYRRVFPGMEVFDASGKMIGKIKTIQMPVAKLNSARDKRPYFLDGKAVSTAMAHLLLQAGFLTLDRGVISDSQVVLLNQIDRAQAGELHLKVTQQELIAI